MSEPSRPPRGRGSSPRFELIAPSANPEETAAIVAALAAWREGRVAAQTVTL